MILITENNLQPMIDLNWDPANTEYGDTYLILNDESMTWEVCLFRDTRSLEDSSKPYTLHGALIETDEDGNTEVTDIIWEQAFAPDEFLNLTEDNIIQLAKSFRP